MVMVLMAEMLSMMPGLMRMTAVTIFPYEIDKIQPQMLQRNGVEQWG